jgi:hypothetical protein
VAAAGAVVAAGAAGAVVAAGAAGAGVAAGAQADSITAASTNTEIKRFKGRFICFFSISHIIYLGYSLSAMAGRDDLEIASYRCLY